MFKSLLLIFRIPKEEEYLETYKEIKEGLLFNGLNFWLLTFAMIMASVGLNQNNLTAIIGAMLISPLMGPVIGIFFGLSSENRAMIRISVRNYIISLIISILASTIYFILTPFSSKTQSLIDYTHASIFDVIMAFIGGMAGFLGIAKKDGVKVIAGVAVATACMPPLCAAGFGLAHVDWEMFFGGIYFYIINSFFIGMGTLVLMKLMKYKLRQNKVYNWMWFISVVLIIPSIWIGYQKWKQEHFSQAADAYIEKIKANYPELMILKYSPQMKNEKEYVDITLLNDTLSFNPKILEEANNLDSIKIRWHFPPNSTLSRLQLLEKKNSILEEKIEFIEAKFLEMEKPDTLQIE